MNLISPVTRPDSLAPDQPVRSAVLTRRTLTAIVVGGGLLRLIPIWFSLDYPQARPDESVAIGRAVAALGGDLNPRFFHWPSLTFYLFAGLFAVTGGVRALLLQDAALSAVEHILAARALVALAGTATLVVLFRIGRRAVDPTTGLLAAGFLAVAILHVRESHFAMTDVLMTFFVTTSLALVLRGLDVARETSPRTGMSMRWFSLAGLAGGLASATKYNAGAVVFGMAAAQVIFLLRGDRIRAWRTWAPSAAFLIPFGLGFLAGTPYALLDSRTFLADLHFNFTHLSGGHGTNVGRGWIYHLARSIPYGTGVPIAVAAVAGVVPAVRHYPRAAFVLGGFGVAFYAAIGSGYTVFFRYILPLVPLVCLSAAVAVRHGGRWLAPRAGLSRGAATVLLAGAIGGPALVNSVWFDALLARTDTRRLAAEWLSPRLRPGDTVHDSGGDYTRLILHGARYHYWPYDPVANSFGHPEGHTPDWLVLHQSPLRQYATVSAGLRRRATEEYELVWEARATKGPAAAAVYDVQDAFFLPVSNFRTVRRPGPSILIYRKKP